MREYDEFCEELEKLRDSGKVILVEGIKDKRALAELDVDKVITLGRRAIYKVVEFISDRYKDCVVLMDLDKEGKKLFGKINSGLSERGVRVDKRFRNFLFKKTKLRQIEGIANYFERIKEKR